MLHSKVIGPLVLEKVFAIYLHGGPLGHGTQLIGINFHTRSPIKMQLWIHSAEPPGEHRYKNRNNNHP